jgi:hypothetical protein
VRAGATISGFFFSLHRFTMEARSLASINYLAANPPQYPVKPNEDRLEPLTLYISRVPGTRGELPSNPPPPPQQHHLGLRI